jgi:hypothetical protein
LALKASSIRVNCKSSTASSVIASRRPRPAGGCQRPKARPRAPDQAPAPAPPQTAQRIHARNARPHLPAAQPAAPPSCARSTSAVSVWVRSWAASTPSLRQRAKAGLARFWRQLQNGACGQIAGINRIAASGQPVKDAGLFMGDAIDAVKGFQMGGGDCGDHRNMRARKAREGAISPGWFMPISITAKSASGAGVPA